MYLAQVVILTGNSLAEAIRMNDICHQHDIGFIKADIRGVFGSVFCDFGKDFEVIDQDGGLLYSQLSMSRKDILNLLFSVNFSVNFT